MKKILLTLLSILVILVIVMVIKMVTYPFQPIKDLKAEPITHQVNDKALERLSKAIQIPTISTVAYEETNFAPFDAFKNYLIESYPAIYETMDTVTVNKYGLVFHWKGKDSSKKPLLFLSHYDVVPINDYEEGAPIHTPTPIFEPNTKATPLTAIQDTWTYPPFSGAVTNGRIYGRGTLDMKGMLISIMEAADKLISEGYQPAQDIYFAFGHDEEVSGRQGALKIAAYFKEHGLTFEAVYDEGGFVISPGAVLSTVDKAMALVGVAEKGFLTLEITVKGMGGHSSMPPKKGSLVLAAEIVEKLNTHQMQAQIIAPIENFLQNIGGAMGTTSKMAIANQWILGGVLLKTLENTPGSNALVRTTTAPTMISSSEAPNVLSATTTMTVNFRILQGNTVQAVMDHVKKICEGYDVTFDIISQREPSHLSDHHAEPYKKLQHIISENYPNAIITPYLSIGGTDAYKYELVSDNVYRFMPAEINAFDQRLIHNDNESITIDNFMRMINHFELLMKQ